ncbi:MAG TPA: inositol monophosphatase family protein [Acidocella sp.]|nr:inositol monophosphatase family protein [Acidocella sp.]HQU03244.1 inositol monophosphatase family protein [Acidocella sp.]
MPNAWVAAAEAALDAAGAAIKPYFRAGVQADDKSDDSPVTVADRLAETIIREHLTTAFPDYGFLGEEFPPTQEAARYVWVVDPIDGTRAFITGRPSFCTLLGLLEDGVPILGFIDQPITGERWAGGRDMPPRFRNKLGGKIGTRAITRLDQAELSSTAPEMFSGDGAARFAKLQAQCRRTYWGGDAYAYGLLALGQVDIVAECGLKPWDWAALAPVVEAAGGVVTDWAGAKLRLGHSDGSILAAANQTLHAAALAAL